MADEREEIRARIDIVDLVGQRVSLKRVGKSHQGLCPFHDDKRPSFRVSSETGYYRCFACQESGDIFTWVMKTQNVEFVEALEILAARAGVPLTRSAQTSPTEKAQRRAAMTEALSYFRDQLGKSATTLDYCARRGLDRLAVESWEIGYSPDIGDALATHLKRKGFALADCRTLFLVEQDPSGGFYDKFRGRLMFPIRDERGELCAFGGRILGDGVPKYINSSDTPLYRKGRVLYGMNRAKETLSSRRKAVLVEGYLDVIACHSAGVTGAVASLGTALSEDHAALLKRWCDEVTVAYDADAAGQKAASRAVQILNDSGLRARVALFPVGLDPDSLLQTLGPSAVRDAVEKDLTPVSFELHVLMSRSKPSEPAFWTEAVEILASSKSRLEVDEHVERLAAIYPGSKDRVETQRSLRADVVAAMQRRKRGSTTVGAPRSKVAIRLVADGMSSYEVAVFKGFLDESLRASAWTAIVEGDIFESAKASTIAEDLTRSFGLEPPNGPAKQWLHGIEVEASRNALIDVEYDIRSDRASMEVLASAIAELRKRRSSRDFAEIKLGDLTETEKLVEMQRQLRSRTPGADLG